MKCYVYRETFSTMEEMIDLITAAWDSITIENIRNTIEHTCRNMDKIIQNKGKWIIKGTELLPALSDKEESSESG